mmetsp:Transcript_9527/g.23754  ORF Transcript_9527/g.23754 Transcript_9527/m.23754 type:complete len:138 (-) Transcript_9527:35-448(-)
MSAWLPTAPAASARCAAPAAVLPGAPKADDEEASDPLSVGVGLLETELRLTLGGVAVDGVPAVEWRRNGSGGWSRGSSNAATEALRGRMAETEVTQRCGADRAERGRGAAATLLADGEALLLPWEGDGGMDALAPMA